MDPVVLERGRMQQVSCGVAPDPWSSEATIVYVAMQELATRLAHFNTAKRVDESGCRIMKRVAADENLHFLFYRDLAAAAFEVDPSRMTIVLDLVVRAFAMPGVGIEGFVAHTAAIAEEGIFSLLIFHDQVLLPMLRFWGIDGLEGLDAEAEAARERLSRHVARVGRIAARAHQQTLDRVGALASNS
jgi:acyl-[acyl-carrier-protein] desaturase